MSLTPFIRHELEHQPGIAAAPENSCTRCSPPLGREPDILLPGDPAAPGTQVPPQIETPGQTPHPDTDSVPQGVPMTDGTLLLETPEGEKLAPLVAGQAYFRKAGVEHNVINASDHDVVFVETELK